MTDSAVMDWLDAEIRSCRPAVEYAEAHSAEILSAAKQNCVKTIYTTRGDDLGIACPSLVNHRVIGGSKKGRVIKQPPANDAYCAVGYDSGGNPLFFKSINQFGTEQAYFFFAFAGAVWAMIIDEAYGTVSDWRIKKSYYDAQGRIKFYAELEPYGFALANSYEYPQDPEQPVICNFYYYVTHISEEGAPPLGRDTAFCLPLRNLAGSENDHGV